MADFLASFLNYVVNLPWLELTAMLLALAYILFAAAGSIWCWPAAFISTAIYTVIFYDVSLLMESALSVYYLIMAVYGYWVWRKDRTIKKLNNAPPLNIVSWQLRTHAKACVVLTLISIGLGYIMAKFTSADFPYLDTFTTVFAVFATYLVAQKVLENWLYWIVIDAASIYLYLAKDLTPTVVLFVIYVFIASWGYFKWSRLYKSTPIAKNLANG